jgi:hypothetical protein
VLRSETANHHAGDSLGVHAFDLGSKEALRFQLRHLGGSSDQLSQAIRVHGSKGSIAAGPEHAQTGIAFADQYQGCHASAVSGLPNRSKATFVTILGEGVLDSVQQTATRDAFTRAGDAAAMQPLQELEELARVHDTQSET